MEHSQAEYVKGVSNWNFDVAALKASAAAEGPGLAPVPEGGLVTGARMPQLSAVCAEVGRMDASPVLKTACMACLQGDGRPSSSRSIIAAGSVLMMRPLLHMCR